MSIVRTYVRRYVCISVMSSRGATNNTHRHTQWPTTPVWWALPAEHQLMDGLESPKSQRYFKANQNVPFSAILVKGQSYMEVPSLVPAEQTQLLYMRSSTHGQQWLLSWTWRGWPEPSSSAGPRDARQQWDGWPEGSHPVQKWGSAHKSKIHRPH